MNGVTKASWTHKVCVAIITCVKQSLQKFAGMHKFSTSLFEVHCKRHVLIGNETNLVQKSVEFKKNWGILVNNLYI